MPLIDITNPHVIKFLVESYDKTQRLKLKWNNLHGEKVQHAATLTREAKGYHETDVLKQIIVGGMPTINRDNLIAARNKRLKAIRDGTHVPGTSDLHTGHSIVDVGLGNPEEDPRLTRPSTSCEIDPIMREVDVNEKAIIYKGLPYYGREAYLKRRSKKKPEDKYYFMETSGWEYGWRLKDSHFASPLKSGRGRVWRLTKGDKSRTGPQPDPNYYQSPDVPQNSKCSKV